jgi:hypothetical protein
MTRMDDLTEQRNDEDERTLPVLRALRGAAGQRQRGKARARRRCIYLLVSHVNGSSSGIRRAASPGSAQLARRRGTLV